MSDSSVVIWESELLRVRQWIKCSHKDKYHERERLFQCVKTHIGYKDHLRSMQSEALASEDEIDRALDFLGDLDAEDMTRLLQAEAAKAKDAAPRVEVGMSIESSTSSTRELMRPLEMPYNLVSPRSEPKLISMSIPQLEFKPSAFAATMTSSAMLGSDSAGHAPMHDMHVEVMSIRHSDGDECKTEESTPPHLMKNLGADYKLIESELPVDSGNKAEQLKYISHISSKSPQDPCEKKATTLFNCKTELDEHAIEMLSWVSGYRDPDVIRRKRNLRRKRMNTHHYGVALEEERLQIQRHVNKNTGGSDSESEDDANSDYLPAEDEELIERDDSDLDNLLSDDCLDSDKDQWPVKRKRKRLQQVHTTNKKTRSRNVAVARKVDQEIYVDDIFPLSAKTLYSGKSVYCHKAATIQMSSKNADNINIDKSITPTVLQSSGVESERCEKKCGQKPDGQLKGDLSASDSAILEAKTTSNIMRLDVSEDDHQLLGNTNQGGFTLAETALPAMSTMDDMFPRCIDTEQNGAVNNLTDLTSNRDSATQSDGANAAFSHEKTLTTVRDKSAVEKDSTARKFVVRDGSDALKVGETQKITVKFPIEIQPLNGDEGDDSEAETIILDDDEDLTDGQGLDHNNDSESGLEEISNQNNATRGKNYITEGKKDERADEEKSSLTKECDSDAKTRVLVENRRGVIADTSIAGVRQLFDYQPLKLKQKSRATATTVSETSPVHTFADVYAKKASNDSENVTSDQNESFNFLADSTSCVVNSNGLLPRKKTNSTTTTLKGKYTVTRRSTKMLDVEGISKTTIGSKCHSKLLSEKASVDTTDDLDDVPLTMLQKELTKKLDDKPSVKYLTYSGAKKLEDATLYTKEGPRIVSKSRFGGDKRSENSSAALNGHHDINGHRSVYTREPQLSIYDALHMDGQERCNDIRDETTHKRPSLHKKMQEEAARSGTPMVKSRMRETDWDKVPIPKKNKIPFQSSDKQKAMTNSKPQNKASRTSSASSYYGPQTAQSSTSGNSSRKLIRCKRSGNGHRKSGKSFYKHFKGPHHYERHDDRRRRRSSTSRSRSPSPKNRDNQNCSRRNHLSRSKSHFRESYNESGFHHTERLTSISHGHGRTNGRERSFTTKSPDMSKKRKLTEYSELSDFTANGKAKDTDACAKKSKTSQFFKISALPDTLTSNEHDADTAFISDSDDEKHVFKEKAEDIRFDLDSVPVDEFLISRQVYVTGLNPTVIAEQLHEDFGRFSVAVDQETGFPAIDIYPCQRNHLGRGDACVTFKTDKGAHEAVEELNAKNIKNSMIQVRRMDVHTQRILTVQFKFVRDAWRCTGTQCRADVSIWNAKCDMCGRKRVYGPSNTKIGAESWLCSLCFTANEAFSTKCHGCMESLPEVDRSTFYTT
ncbi:putative RNA recognition motif domain, Zinc finger, RanBP2-type, TAF15/EWS/TLS family [Plasmopara halstedii]